VILVTSIVWDKFLPSSVGYQPTVVEFPDYTKEEILRILALDCPVGESPNFYTGFVELLYNVFNHSSKNPNELRHMASLLFPKYREPVDKGLGRACFLMFLRSIDSPRPSCFALGFPVKKTETVKLFRHVDPYIKRMLDKLYLREISHAEWDSMKEKIQTEQEVIESVVAVSEQDFEFPYYTKFLLLAAYISSYNPARLDLRYFTKAGEGHKKGTKRAGKGADRQRMLEGPRNFPLARMFAIFHNILEDPIDNTVDLQTQVSTLVSQKLLVQHSKLDALGNMKYRCNANYDFILKIARSVRFSLNNFLYEH